MQLSVILISQGTWKAISSFIEFGIYIRNQNLQSGVREREGEEEERGKEANLHIPQIRIIGSSCSLQRK